MTPEIIFTLFVVLSATILFISERLRADVVALLVLGVLAATGMVTPSEALSGFSNPAVVTVWAMFIISGGLTQTGIANWLGEQVLRLAGQGEIRLLLVIMSTAAVLSAFMNNVGVAALMLPVVIVIARQTGRSPSRLLLPLAYACLLGGLLTLIGTPPNILVSDALRENGLPPFKMFDFFWLGGAVLVASFGYILLIGRHLLPKTRGQDTALAAPNLPQLYGLQERLLTLTLPADSHLVGKTLAASRLGSVLGLNAVGIVRQGKMELSPRPTTVLQAGDRLLVIGRDERLEAVRQQTLAIESATLTNELLTADMTTAVFELTAPHLAHKTLVEIAFRQQYGVNVLAIQRGATMRSHDLASVTLHVGDRLIVQGSPSAMNRLAETADFNRLETDDPHWPSDLLLIRIPPDSKFVGQTLADSRLGETLDLTVLGKVQDGALTAQPAPDAVLQAGDLLLVYGNPDNVAALNSLTGLQVTNGDAPTAVWESDEIGLLEVTLSPHAALGGKTLRQLHFREKYGLSVVAIWRGGRAYRHALRDMPLRLGDGLLLHGRRDAAMMLADETDFIVLGSDVQPPVRRAKAPLALAIMGLVLLPAVFNWLPISISAVIGATLLIITGCLTIDEAYHYIEWKAVFLIAGMLPLGIAMQTSGTAEFLAGSLVNSIGQWGVMAVLAGLFLLTNLASQIMPSAVVVVLMSPIVLTTAVDLGVSPYTFMMGMAMAALNFLSPVGHPANMLVMGPGGYKFTDYIKFGLPLTLIVMVVVLILLPVLWPL